MSHVGSENGTVQQSTSTVLVYSVIVGKTTRNAFSTLAEMHDFGTVLRKIRNNAFSPVSRDQCSSLEQRSTFKLLAQRLRKKITFGVATQYLHDLLLR